MHWLFTLNNRFKASKVVVLLVDFHELKKINQAAWNSRWCLRYLVSCHSYREKAALFFGRRQCECFPREQKTSLSDYRKYLSCFDIHSPLKLKIIMFQFWCFSASHVILSWLIRHDKPLSMHPQASASCDGHFPLWAESPFSQVVCFVRAGSA